MPLQNLPVVRPRQFLRRASGAHAKQLAGLCPSRSKATKFSHYVETTYIPIALRKMAKSTQDRYKGVITNYLEPAVGKLCLRDLTPATVDRFFAGLADEDLSQESLDKIRDVLASVIKRAIRHGLLAKTPTASSCRAPNG